MAFGVDQPIFKIEFSPTTNPLATPVWVEITSYFIPEGFSIRRGRQDETGPMQAGRATLLLLNSDRRFDPEYTSGPYGANIKPMRRIRISAIWNGVTYILFTGYVETWRPEYDLLRRSICRVSCVDAFGTFFARQTIGGEAYVRVCPTRSTVYSPVPFVGDPALVDTVTVPWPVPRSRKIRASFTGTVATTNRIRVEITGVTTGGSTVSEILDLMNGSTNPSVLSTNTYASLSYIQVYPVISFNAADIGKPLVVAANNVFAQEFTGDALTTLLNATAWPSGDRSIQNGKSLIQSYTATGGSVLSYAQAIADTEGGVLFISRDGLLTFKNRHNRITLATTATFGDGGGELPYEDVQFDYGERYIYTQVRVIRTGGTEQIAQDLTTSDAYFPRTYPTSGSRLHTTDAETANQASFTLSAYKTPRTRVTSLRVNGEASPAALWPVLLAADLQQQYTVIRRPPGGGTITKTGVLESISITMNRPTAIEIGWGFSPSDTGQFWVLGSSALGSTTRLAY